MCMPEDGVWWLNYNQYEDLRLNEVGIQRCSESYEFGPIIRDIYILHYVFEGEGILYINEKEYVVKAHQFFLLPPGTLVRYQASSTNPWHYIWVQFHGFKATELLQKIGFSKKNPVYIPTSSDEVLVQCLKEIVANRKKEYFCIANMYLLFQYMIDMAPDNEVKNQKTEPALNYVRCAVDYINQKFCEPVLVRNIAEHCGVDRAYLSKIFKYATGFTLQEYLIQFRIKKAKQLLKETQLSVQYVSYSVGYNDPFTFSKVFKKQTGLSPTEWRKKNLQY